jgi:hypothetical protein
MAKDPVTWQLQELIQIWNEWNGMKLPLIPCSEGNRTEHEQMNWDFEQRIVCEWDGKSKNERSSSLLMLFKM